VRNVTESVHARSGADRQVGRGGEFLLCFGGREPLGECPVNHVQGPLPRAIASAPDSGRRYRSLKTTLPKQMWDGILLQVSPIIAAASVVVLVVVILMFAIMECVQERSAAARRYSQLLAVHDLKKRSRARRESTG